MNVLLYKVYKIFQKTECSSSSTQLNYTKICLATSEEKTAIQNSLRHQVRMNGWKNGRIDNLFEGVRYICFILSCKLLKHFIFSRE